MNTVEAIERYLARELPYLNPRHGIAVDIAEAVTAADRPMRAPVNGDRNRLARDMWQADGEPTHDKNGAGRDSYESDVHRVLVAMLAAGWRVQVPVGWRLRSSDDETPIPETVPCPGVYLGEGVRACMGHRCPRCAGTGQVPAHDGIAEFAGWEPPAVESGMVHAGPAGPGMDTTAADDHGVTRRLP